MKKTAFLLGLTILLFASCSQIARDEGNSVTLNISGRSLLARAVLDENELNEVYNLTIDLKDDNSEKNLKSETGQGTISELQDQTFTFDGIPVGRSVKFYCYLSKDGIAGYFWQGESEAVRITGGNNDISIRMLETNPSGDTTPLTILEDFLPPILRMDYNYYEAGNQHQISTQYKLTASNNKRKIKAGDKYTLIFNAQIESNSDFVTTPITINGYYFNICQKFYEGMDYSQVMLSKGGSGNLNVTNGQIINFKKTIIIEKDAPDEIVLDLTFHLKDPPIDYLPKEILEEIYRGNSLSYKDLHFEFPVRLTNVRCTLYSSNVEIAKKLRRDKTPLTVASNPKTKIYGHYINAEQGRNDFSNEIWLGYNGNEEALTNNQRALQEGDEFYISLSAFDINTEITGGFFIIGDYGDLQDWNNIMLSDGCDIPASDINESSSVGTWYVTTSGRFRINRDAKTKNPVLYLILFTEAEPDPDPNNHPTLDSVSVYIESSNVNVIEK